MTIHNVYKTELLNFARIPFPVTDWKEAEHIYQDLMKSDAVIDSRGDFVRFEEDDLNQKYVVIYTGNIAGLVHDLTCCGWL